MLFAIASSIVASALTASCMNSSDATVRQVSDVAVSCTESNTGSAGVIAEPSARNAAAGSVVRRPIWSTLESIGTTSQPAARTWAKFLALSMIRLDQRVGTIALPELVVIARTSCPIPP